MQIDELRENKIPSTIEELTALGKSVLSVSRHSTQVLSIVVTRGRAIHPDAKEWVKWTSREFTLTTQHLHHLYRIGRMMLSVKSDLLWELVFDSLYAISYLVDAAPEQLAPFLAAYPGLARESRERINYLVRQWLDPAWTPPEQPDLARFKRMLDNLRAVTPEAWRQAFRTEKNAYNALMTAAGLMDASVGWYADNGRADVLRTVKSALQATLTEIDQALGD